MQKKCKKWKNPKTLCLLVFGTPPKNPLFSLFLQKMHKIWVKKTAKKRKKTAKNRKNRLFSLFRHMGKKALSLPWPLPRNWTFQKSEKSQKMKKNVFFSFFPRKIKLKKSAKKVHFWRILDLDSKIHFFCTFFPLFSRKNQKKYAQKM